MRKRNSRERRGPKLVAAENENVSIKNLNWRRMFGYLKPYWKQMALALVGLVVSTGLGLVFPLVIVRLLDTATQSKTFGALNNLALTLIGLFVFQAAFGFVQSYFLSFVGEHIVLDLRT